MNTLELTLMLLLAAGLVWLAVYFGRRQWQSLLRAASSEISPDERRYLRAQAHRRLFCSGLMVIFSGLLVGGVFLEGPRRDLAEQIKQQQIDNPDAPFTDEQNDFVRLYSTYWIVALLLLLVLMGLAAVDFWATARFGLQQHRRLQADHRAELLEQAARYKQDRNGAM